MFNSLAVVGAVLLLAGTLFVTTMYSSYYQVMSERLETQATTAASFLQSYATEQEYLSAARYYMTSNPSTPSNPSNPGYPGGTGQFGDRRSSGAGADLERSRS